MRTALHLFDRCCRQARLPLQHVQQHAPIGITLLHAAIFRIHPDAAAVATADDVGIAQHCRILRVSAAPALHALVARVVAHQLIQTADPHLPRWVFGQ
ncbi:hypothetical protein D3C81_1492810 [compost metagenome]